MPGYVSWKTFTEKQVLTLVKKLNPSGRGGGGPVDVLVKNKIAWPHEAIVGGVNLSRVTYDQLTMSQWVQGFCRNILDKKDQGKHEHMLMYVADLMEDATGFNWQSTKVVHAVLWCELECGSVKWGDTLRIDRIRLAQKHSCSAKMAKIRGFEKTLVLQVFPTGNLSL